MVRPVGTHHHSKLAILASGGPAPGINAVIGSATIRSVLSGVEVLGVNARDLATFGEDLGAAAATSASIPDGTIAVAESAIRGVDDAAAMAAVGFDAVLVG